ncbi:MAG: YadA-like family protein [Burkholderiales bacterium]|nr:YadA-like family protein [Burkholderiales bacterium]
MNRIYKVIFSRRTGMYVVTSEVAKAMGKGAMALGVVALANIGLPDSDGVIQAARAQTLPESPCTAGSGGTMYGGTASCVNYVNNTRVYLNSLSTLTSTQVSSLSAGVSSLSTGVSSLSTGLSTTNSNLTSLSTSTSTGVSSLSTGVSSLSTGVSSLSTGVSSLSTSVSSLSTSVKPVTTAYDAAVANGGTVGFTMVGSANAVDGTVNTQGRVFDSTVVQTVGVSCTTVSGLDTTATGTCATAGANGATAYGSQAQAIGVNTTAIGFRATASGSGDTALGYQTQATGGNATAIGYNSTASGAGSIALGASNTATGTESIAIGYGNTVTGNNSGVIGDPNIISGNGSYALGNNNTVSSNNTFVIGNNVIVPAGNDGSVVLGNNSTASGPNTVSVGSAGNERTITNVAAGVNPTDAVNVSQLKDYTQYYTQNLSYQINEVAEKAYSGVALAGALAGIPQVESNKQFNIGMGVSNYGSSNALAIGASGRVSDSTIVKFGVSTATGGHTMVNGGIGYSW